MRENPQETQPSVLMTPGPARESVSTPVTKKRDAWNSAIEAVEREKRNGQQAREKRAKKRSSQTSKSRINLKRNRKRTRRNGKWLKKARKENQGGGKERKEDEVETTPYRSSKLKEPKKRSSSARPWPRYSKERQW